MCILLIGGIRNEQKAYLIGSSGSNGTLRAFQRIRPQRKNGQQRRTQGQQKRQRFRLLPLSLRRIPCASARKRRLPLQEFIIGQLLNFVNTTNTLSHSKAEWIGDMYWDGEKFADVWTVIGGKKYFFSTEGIMRTGLRSIDGVKYYFDEDGVLKSGKIKIGSKTYYFGKDGAMYKGWLELNGHTYYFMKKDGSMAVGKVKIDGTIYEFDKNGRLLDKKTDD